MAEVAAAAWRRLLQVQTRDPKETFVHGSNSTFRTGTGVGGFTYEIANPESLAGGPRPIAPGPRRNYTMSKFVTKNPKLPANWSWYERPYDNTSVYSLANRCKVVRMDSKSVSADKYVAPDYIPVYGIPVAGDPHNYLLRQLYSMDVPIKHLLVVYGNNDPILQSEINHLLDLVLHVDIIHCPDMLGCAEAWNLILKTYYETEPWFMISATDVAWPPGMLRRLANNVWDDVEDMGLDFATISYTNGPVMSGYWHTRVYTKAVLERAGLYDENIFPAYHEDIEFMTRLHHLDPPIVAKNYYDVMAVHGQSTAEGYRSGTTFIQDGNFKSRVNRAWGIAKAYLAKKWRCSYTSGLFSGTDGKCGFNTPFDIPGAPIGFWRFHEGMRKYILTGDGFNTVESDPTFSNPPYTPGQ